MNLPKIILGFLVTIVVILGIYTLMTIVGPNYDYKYAEMLSSGEIINPAMEYVGDIGEGAWNFLSQEITTSKFLNISMILPARDSPDDDVEAPDVQSPETESPLDDDANQSDPLDLPEDDSVVDTEPVEDEETEIEEELEELEDVVVKDEDKKELIKYILILMRAYNLHNPPLSSDTPKMEFDMEGEKFNAEVIKGEIYVNEGPIEGEDVRINSNWGEAVVMSQGLEYVKTSFGSGRSTIEQVCDTKICFLKGYKEIYDELSTE